MPRAASSHAEVSAWPPPSSTPPPRPGSKCSPLCAATGSWPSCRWSCSSRAAVVLGLKRPVDATPTTANLSVGHVYVSNAGGHPDHHRGDAVAGRRSTAGRSAPTEVIAGRATDGCGMSTPCPSPDGLSATPIPQSPLIKVSAESRIRARGGRPRQCRRGGAGRPTSTARCATTTPRRRSPRATCEAAVAYRRSLETSSRLARRYSNDPTRDEQGRARSRRRCHRHRATATRRTERRAIRPPSRAAPRASAWTSSPPASTPTSDRSRMLQILVFVGLLGGLAAGLALALLRASRDLRRRARDGCTRAVVGGVRRRAGAMALAIAALAADARRAGRPRHDALPCRRWPRSPWSRWQSSSGASSPPTP